MPNMIISTYRDSKEIIHAYKSVSSYKSAAKRFCVYLPLRTSNYPEQGDFYLMYNWSGVQISNIGGWGASPPKANNEQAFRREEDIFAGELCFV